ncbi:Laccase 1 [Pseudocercospora fuligena]|uniref:Laccase 1 n=1 Tax=Pseudocercospora fuligena TaxID=685502 RepID=A0A8H6RUR1_9PEZI|nr:Laccase 1 [Pseudocercospora fuligena]
MVSASSFLVCALGLCSYASAKTVYFAIEVAWGQVAPDGYSRAGILVNGTSPGPALIVDQGDDVQFYVRNRLNKKTTVHFHGIEQLNTPWSDGVPGLSQRPIPVGGDWLYKWKATEYGTYWYHAHYQSQISDGFFGAIHIRPRASEPRPFSEMPGNQQQILAAEADPQFVIFSDWMHVTSDQHFALQQRSNVDLYCVQSILFNGRGRVNCLTPEQRQAALAPPFRGLYQALNASLPLPNGCLPFTPRTQTVHGQPAQIRPDQVPPEITGCSATNAPLTDFQVDASKRWVSFNIIGAASLVSPVISLDQHDLWVYAIDGRYIKPYKAQGILVNNGDRYSVMIELNQRPGTYTLRANNFALNQLISGFATVTYVNGGSSGGGPSPPKYGRGDAGFSSDGGFSFDISFKEKRAVEGANVEGRRPTRLSQQIERRQQSPAQSTSRPYFTYGGFPVQPGPGTILLNQTSPGVVPFPNVPPSQNVQQTRIFYMSRFQAPYLWTVDGDQSYPEYPTAYAQDRPLLYYPNSQEANNNNLVVKTRNGTWVDLVFVVLDLFGPPHPMHKHSNKAYIVGQGIGNWTWNSVAEAAAAQPQNFNFDTPGLRDGFTTPPNSGTPTWLVVRYYSENPGAWMLHCHIQTHLTGGMAVALLDGIDVFPKRFPREYQVNGNGLGRRRRGIES